MADWIGGNRFLTLHDQVHNAQLVVDYLVSLGWHAGAIIGTIVNMSAESNVNPQIWENLTYDPVHNGYGLVQWTPAGDKIIPWCEERGLDYTNGDNQLLRINYEAQNGLQWGENVYLPDPAMPELPHYPPITFAQYTQLDDAVLADKYWLAYYEMPGYSGMLSRYLSASYDVANWRRYLNIPELDERKMPVWMYLRRRFF